MGGSMNIFLHFESLVFVTENGVFHLFHLFHDRVINVWWKRPLDETVNDIIIDSPQWGVGQSTQTTVLSKSLKLNFQKSYISYW